MTEYSSADETVRLGEARCLELAALMLASVADELIDVAANADRLAEANRLTAVANRVARVANGLVDLPLVADLVAERRECPADHNQELERILNGVNGSPPAE